MTDDERPERTPPHDPAAEQCVLGGMLLSRDAIADATEVIAARDFYRPIHATIWSVILDQYARGEPTDQIAVAARMAEQGTLGKVGGAVYLHTLVSTVPTAANVGHYAHIVRRRAARRRLIEAGTRIVQLGYSADGTDDDELPERAAQELETATSGRVSGELVPVSARLNELMEALERGAEQGLSTGLVDLDRLTGGMQPGQLWVVAARPGMGKSVLLADFARSVALRQRQRVLFFSLEMSWLRLNQRILAAESRVPLHLIRTGAKQFSEEDWTRVMRAFGELDEPVLHVEEGSSVSITDIGARARRLAQRQALALIVVDYLQLMEGIATRGNENREREVARISRGLKVLAGELGVPIVVAAQLNRGPEQRTDKRPVLSDLRESGAIEADADVVILLHRPDYYDRESARAGEVDLIVAKNRDGETDTVTAASQLHFSRFVDVAIDDIYTRVARQQAA